MYELAGFEETVKDLKEVKGLSELGSDFHMLFQSALTRYHCKRMTYDEQITLIDNDLRLSHRGLDLDLGTYPLPSHIIDEPIEYNEENDFKFGRMKLQDTFEITEDESGNRFKVFRNAFMPPEESNQLLVLNFQEFSAQIDRPYREELQEFCTWNNTLTTDIIDNLIVTLDESLCKFR